MAKFCANCGAHMEDSDLVCGQCGTPSGNPSGNEGQVNNTKNKGCTLKILAGAFAAIVIIAIIINVVLASSSYKSTLNKMVKAIKNNDITGLQVISSPVNDDVYGVFDYESMLERFLENKLDYYEDRLDGEVRKISYEIKDKSEITERKMEKYKDMLSDSFGADTSGIKKMVKVKLKLSIKGDRKTTSDNIDELYLIKENGRWTIYFDDYGVLD